jgi:O-antigen/teichoic acid export membrane protein
MVVPWFFARRDPPPSPQAVKDTEGGLTLRRGAGFAAAVFAVMVAEQTLINGAVLTVEGTSPDPALAGYVFSVLLISRAPLQLFQAIQGSLLPHLASLEATASRDEFGRAIRTTVLAIGAFAAAVALGLLVVGPPVIKALFDVHHDLVGGGLALVGLGMGFHLVAGTFNQALLARGKAQSAAVAWLVCAGIFIAWMLTPVIDDQLLRTEVGYCGATALLAALLFGLYRRGR